MRVNNISNTLNFKRVVPINYTQLRQAKRSHGIDEALLELEDILNSNEPFYYSKAESAKIREFFDRKIEDYNGKKGVLIVKTRGGAALLTGKDAKHVKNVRASGKGNDVISGIVGKRIENGKFGKPESKITLVSDARKKAEKSGKVLSEKAISRFDSIKYTYSSKRPEKFVAKDGRTYTSWATEIYDDGEIEI